MTETSFDEIYKNIVLDIVHNGKMQQGNVRAKYADGTPAYAKYIHGVNFVITPDELPILHTKRVACKTALTEIEWIWQEMSNDVNWLNDRKVTIWDEWKGSDGTIGLGYGYQLKNRRRQVKITKDNADERDLKTLQDGDYRQIFRRLNQVEYILHEIKHNPRSRRIITSLWNVDDLHLMNLEPCVYETQWEVDDDDFLILHVRQRGADVANGLPFNVAQYSVLHRLIADVTGKKVGNMYWNIGNAHIYDRHLETLEQQVERDLSDINSSPKLILPQGDGFFDRRLSQAKIVDYTPLDINFKYEIAI